MSSEMSLDLSGENFTVFAPQPGEADRRLAAALAEDARFRAETGILQQAYAEMAKDLLNECAARHFGDIARIAVRHYKRAAIGFRQAVAGFESAAKLQKQTKARRELLRQAEAVTALAEQAEDAVCDMSGTKPMGAQGDETG